MNRGRGDKYTQDNKDLVDLISYFIRKKIELVNECVSFSVIHWRKTPAKSNLDFLNLHLV